MKRLLIVLFLAPFFVAAQNKALVIEGIAPNLYVSHTVAPKENYYSIGRIYNISPKEIAPFNKLVLDSGLSLGRKLKIPLSPANFLQSGNPAADEVLIPVYHIVQGKEGMYRVSANYNKLPLETIKQWNNLKADAVTNGTALIVGYLKVKKDLSPLANLAKAMPPVNPVKAAGDPDKVVAIKEAPKAGQPKEPLPAVKGTPKEKPALAEKIKKEPIEETVIKEPAPEKKVITNISPKKFSGGVFKADYEKQTNNKDVSGETGEAAIFKSTSGWEDGKYYCLHNTSSPGTIVKVTNTSNGKSIYAKVLDVIPDITQNSGLLLRISNAAAEELGAADGKFDCNLSYSK